MRGLIPVLFFVSGALCVAGPALSFATDIPQWMLVSIVGLAAFGFGCIAETSP